MSRLTPNDAELHYEDGSHRWTGGDGTLKGDAAWRARVSAHQRAHRTGEKGTNPGWWPGRLQQGRPVRDGDGGAPRRNP